VVKDEFTSLSRYNAVRIALANFGHLFGIHANSRGDNLKLSCLKRELFCYGSMVGDGI